MTTLKSNLHKSWHSKALNLLFCASGIVLFYSIYSLFQETIIKQKYGNAGDRFVFMQTLIAIPCAFNTIVAFIFKFKTNSNDTVPLHLYAMCSVSYILAMLFGNLSLTYVNYPTQVLSKSCKPIPILVSGVLFAHKSYPVRKYFCVLLMVTGMGIFLYKEKSDRSYGGFNFGTGELLLLMSLSMDGVTGAVQDRIRHYYFTDKWFMMFYMNFISLIFLGSSVIFTGELWTFLAFVHRYPYVLKEILLFSLTGLAGQCFIFKTINEFGPLTCSIVTTLRKLFSVIFSIAIFNHAYTARNIVGAGVVFFGLFLDAFDSKRSHKQFDSKQRIKT